ncbi:MAG TPA: RNA polymerase subunit sigma-24 [Anaerolinea thermolimosa]|uniref:RNA polymerase subunit sigma-24 n=1 Tax=Anaerolinea thermolimosa TaxID=229919 RepID=A0A3D1JHV5_9CHLR|nr:sigma-70 family RNA polymerase sigma factor [Anaerolinea thermolimosa]GAP07154.1 RNA polymerase, sigma subunit, ECF family [Anaerolinea thermolimosa]HCE18024.1 RNA polymerase subunit sigma-24 [Anaerolinea thermolimosa]
MNNLEAEWLQQAIHGDDNAFSLIVETYQRPVYNLCYRMLGDPQEAEDAAQETFWRAYQALNRYDQQRPFATWLLSIAAHYCIDQQRKRRFPTLALDLLPEETIPDATPNPEKVFLELEHQGQIQRLLARLSPPDRAAIILRYWYQFSEEEIARSLSLSISAVKSRLFRARRELAQAYEAPAASALPERRKNESPAL